MIKRRASIYVEEKNKLIKKKKKKKRKENIDVEEYFQSLMN